MDIGHFLPQVDGDSATVVVRLLDRSENLRDDSWSAIRGPRTSASVLGTATIVLELDPGDPSMPTGRATEVGLQMSDALDSEQLRTFPWRRVIAAAAATYRARHSNSLDVWRAATEASSPTQPAARRPGRPGKSLADYQLVADRYRALVQQGETAPTTRIAQEFVVSRSTAASWVRRARQHGLLDAAARDKPARSPQTPNTRPGASRRAPRSRGEQ